MWEKNAGEIYSDILAVKEKMSVEIFSDTLAVRENVGGNFKRHFSFERKFKNKCSVGTSIVSS